MRQMQRVIMTSSTWRRCLATAAASENLPSSSRTPDEPGEANATSSSDKRRHRTSDLECVLAGHKNFIESLEEKLLVADKNRLYEQQNKPNVLLENLPEIERRTLINARLVPVGSRVSGLSSHSSDLDLVFFPLDPSIRKEFYYQFYENPELRLRMMTVFRSLLRRELSEMGLLIREIIVLAPVKVPVIICKFLDGHVVDIQFPRRRFESIRNTAMLRIYNSMDPRLGRLFLWLRTLCNALEIRNSKHGLLSSYHLLMLLIHFLQSAECQGATPILPVLAETHTNLIRKVPIDELSQQLCLPQLPPDYSVWQSQNKQTTAELAIRFVDYYANRIDLRNYNISIANGNTQRKRIPKNHLFIADPFTWSKSVCSSQIALDAFSAGMQFTWRRMVTGTAIDTFPDFPETSDFQNETKYSSWRRAANRRAQVVIERIEKVTR